MTVGELVAQLRQFDPEQMVYVPGLERKAELVKSVGTLVHDEGEIEGVVVPPDVFVIPWTEQEFVELFGGSEA